MEKVKNQQTEKPQRSNHSVVRPQRAAADKGKLKGEEKGGEKKGGMRRRHLKTISKTGVKVPIKIT